MTETGNATGAPRRTVLDMNSYQWTVLFAAWLGWGFDVFDGLLFNYVAPNCVPHSRRMTRGFAKPTGANTKHSRVLHPTWW